MSLPSADKKLGQHFLRDQNVINSITEDFAKDCDAIIEVGPGPGILTKNLANIGKPFYVIEKDARFPEYLEDYIKREQITLGDALEINYDEFLSERNLTGKKIWLVSNLPYNVSVPLTIKFLQCSDIKFMTLMYQLEVAEKIIAIDERKKNIMGSLMSLCTNYFDVSLLLKVLPGAFCPPPKVDSAVLSFKRLEAPVVSLEAFKDYEEFLRTIFAFKRKQLGSVLKNKFDKVKMEMAFNEVGIERTIRAEALDLDTVRELYRALRK